MIVSKTPLRITLAGGGTDLPSYYKKNTGYVISMAINKNIYISVNKTFVNYFQLKYSDYEKVKNINQIKHNLIREQLKYFDIKDKLEISSIADVPSGTGLGSSGSFGVGLFNALQKLKKLNLSKREIALKSSKIEMEKVKAKVGHQDNIIATYGGITEQNYSSKFIKINKMKITKNFQYIVNNNLVMFYTNLNRSASDILSNQDKLSKLENKKIINNLNETKKLGLEVRKLIIEDKFHEYHRILHEHWKIKKIRDKNISNPKINQMFDFGIKNGAISGKLIGAGGGGFFLFYTRDKKRLVKAFERKKVPDFRFKLNIKGSEILK